MSGRAAASLTRLRRGVWHLRRGGMKQLRAWSLRERSERHQTGPGGLRGAEGAWSGRGPRRHLSFAAGASLGRPPRRAELRVGVILDEFSLAAFDYEWTTVLLDPRRWREQCETEQLDFVFIESAWSGNSRLWRGKIGGPAGPSSEFRHLMAWCREQGLPTAFWNKEDPPHYADFLQAATLADWVFTSDEGRIGSYCRDLGHERVAVLPFAAQPAIHNPVRPLHGRHSRDIAFAGMYFAHKYPERREQLQMLLGGAMDASPTMEHGLEIFSRLLDGGAEYQFPAPLDSRVVGSLRYDQMLTAYKAYKVFLNVNSVVDSPSMCARRIFEISASGTPVVSAPSAAIPEFFQADEVPVASTRAEARQLVRALVRNSELNDRTAHLAQRRIWAGHTYAHRAERVVAAVVPHRSEPVRRPSVSALVPTIRRGQLEQLCRTIGGQVGVQTQLVLLAHGIPLSEQEVRAVGRAHGIDDVVFLTEPSATTLGACLNRCADAADGEVLAKMDDDDHYGPQYLSDQLFALDYSGADLVGKQAHYMHLTTSDAVILRSGEREHRFTDFVMGPTIVARAELMASNPFPDLRRGEDTAFLRTVAASGGSVYSSDRFNYVQVRSATGHTWQIGDAELLAAGDLKFYGRPYEHVDI
ncbi:glycosyltransferase [Arthrobacter agilis]|nr:glycosyltransferase [Arthrobacter agilis]OUM45550.1 glycosyltransferase [Arthrobacter agilis]TPV21671.1 glycosyltransferase [Arthrobacter agilis]